MKLGAVNVTNCDQEPIHLIDLVQPSGYQLIYSLNGDLVNHSNNIAALYGKSMPRRIDSLVTQQNLDVLLGNAQHTIRQNISIGEEQFSLYAFRGGECMVIELEPVTFRNNDYTLIASRFIRQLEITEDISAASGDLAAIIRDILDYDRVMVYAFDDE